MEKLAICPICGRPAQFSCSMCGRIVCDKCIDSSTGLCAACKQGKKV